MANSKAGNLMQGTLENGAEVKTEYHAENIRDFKKMPAM